MGWSGSKTKKKPDPRLSIIRGKANPSIKEAKVVLLGDSGVGKSSIVMRYINGTYSEGM